MFPGSSLFFLLGGIIWLGRAIPECAEPNYWNPITALDYTAVVGTTLQMLILAAVLWGLYLSTPLSPSGKQKVWLLGIVIATAASILHGISNFIEDALGIEEFVFAYALGGFGVIIGLPLAMIGSLIHSETRFRLPLFLFAYFIGVGFPDLNLGIVTGIALMLMGSD